MENPPDPETVAEQVIQRLQDGEDNEWDNIRFNTASELRINNDYKKTKIKIQDILNSTPIKRKIMASSTNEFEIAELVELGGGTKPYKDALLQLLTQDTEFGKELFNKISKLVDDIVGREVIKKTTFSEMPSMESATNQLQ
ncbi:hypothetical protein TVAG_006400 [Trichomonas vaginalis G3]|uniref:Uncharacterized protein n=1 Tax=Trichomonas vaginalis (strain ATCC PRA-98 / G3) TaxID=412133 RepID=A2E747_TRIV3|nr:hypothetical protein TVAGG3_0982940 [Trichomonas vaginalis G3]EAY11565.1 hypothetical protein TVAG_006400 [Trichomonas vaginalis G3]KAI5489449.1 hypothetical protein TVAGG3_0982940 [Trichomonas vaginalis G3]|eukprot:XP_001323788.1 hypothetical protein [Trichomonas vaginalis G3]